MPSSLLVVVVVALGSGDDGAAVARTAQDALGSDAVVVLREEANLEDANVSHLGQELHASALVRITWSGDAARPQAHVHLYATGAAAWMDRDVPFAPEDPVEERARALGYGVASMVRISVPPPEPSAAAKPAEPERAPATVPRPPARFWVDARLQGAEPLGSAGASLGGEGAIGYRVSRAFAARVGAGLRVGELEAAGASASYLRLGGGVLWTILETRGPRPVSLGARVDALALRQSASRHTNVSSDSRWIFATDVFVEAGWAVLPRGAFVGAIGTEAGVESTRVLVNEREVARIAPIRLVGELGIRVGLD